MSQGDETAFGILFHTYHNKLGSYILKLTESFPLTEEIVQDVFLSIWQHRATLQDIHQFEPYLFVIARNRAFNCLKQMARERLRQEEWASHLQDEPDVYMEGQEGYESLIDQAISQLPPQQKKVYQLHNQQNMRYPDIALQLGLSATTVKKHMSLALRKIRDYVSTHMDPVSILFLCCLLLTA
ncbi:MAG TPA: RNA polymerase sigma-70 factor [Puia sp.]|nr:RNA polymerase sigma-70 factor [Puia sp.]